MQGRRGRGGSAATIYWSKKIFFYVKFLHVNNKWDFTLFIDQDINDQK